MSILRLSTIKSAPVNSLFQLYHHRLSLFQIRSRHCQQALNFSTFIKQPQPALFLQLYLSVRHKKFLQRKFISTMEFSKPETVLDLNIIRECLVRLEDTILFDLIERAQFYKSPSVYDKTKLSIPGWDGSFLEWFIYESECTQAKIRRYESPDEEPFSPRDKLPKPILPDLNYPPVLAWYTREVNINDTIKDVYINQIVPLVAAGGESTLLEQSEYLGSTALSDLGCLQSLSRRIHFGKFVAESKFRSEEELFTKMIKEQDAKGIEAAITKPAVEAKILDRIEKKAETYGIDPTLRWSEKSRGKVDPKAIRKIYEDFIIPLTRKVEVDYLLRRLEPKP